MQNIETPNVSSSAYGSAFKMRLLNTRKSGYLGIFLIILPIIFITGMIFKYNFGIELPVIYPLSSWIGEMDKVILLKYFIRFLLVGGPLMAFILNLLSILHLYYDKERKELIFSVKISWFNLIIITVGVLIQIVFFLYLVVENSMHS